MTNEQYLIVSYFVVGVLCVGLAAGVYLWLRRSFTEIAQTVSSTHFARILRGLFPLGIMLPALLGFVSVTFYSCGINTYGKIIENRAYLVAKNQEQLSTSMFNVVIALFVWCFIVAGVLLAIKWKPTDRQPTQASSVRSKSHR